MLKNLQIQNVALIENLLIDFSDGLNVLSGETGAGKSIVIDSLNFVVGGKTSKSIIRQNEKFMKVVALFYEENFNLKIREKFQKFDIELENEILISRKMFCDGKIETKVNGVSITNTMLKEISCLLIDIHGQHEHQKLLKEKYHIEILDSFFKDKTLFLSYQENFNKLKVINREISLLNGSSSNPERILDLLSYQIKEIENAKLKENEDEELSQKKLVLQNSEKISNCLEEALKSLEGNTYVVSQIKESENNLKSIIKFDESLNQIVDRLDNIRYEIIDIVEILKDKNNSTNFDKDEFEKIDERLDLIKSLKKKYGPSLEDVFIFLSKAKKEYDDVINSKDKIKELLNKKTELIKILYLQASEISAKRKQIAKEFEERVGLELKDLGMKNSKLFIEFNDFKSIDDCENAFKENGFDEVRFMFTANVGQNFKPLSEIISGGEASRFMLALKNILSRVDDISTMIFDEIDTGISGEMGFMVACKMANIGLNRQVIAVSHLPQICAMANKNIKVEKVVQEEKTIVIIKDLIDKEILKEISRLSGGEEGNGISIDHAKELKNRCKKYIEIIK